MGWSVSHLQHAALMGFLADRYGIVRRSTCWAVASPVRRGASSRWAGAAGHAAKRLNIPAQSEWRSRRR
jgi:hypothetical protein